MLRGSSKVRKQLSTEGHWGSVEVVGGTELAGVVHTKGRAQTGESPLGLKASDGFRDMFSRWPWYFKEVCLLPSFISFSGLMQTGAPFS